CGAQTRVPLALRQHRGTGVAQPAVAAGVAASELFHPDEEGPWLSAV
ncbi:hypothetical protein (fragment), partial [Mycobacterium canettii CIPT 140010059]